jgi:hypothetical protein
MGLPPFFVVILLIVIISAVVGAVAKMVNNQNEQNANPNAPRPRVPAPPGGGGDARTGNSDMDRFLAEIDRLRRKTAEAPPPPPNQVPAVPVVQPTKQPDRPRARVVAELAEPQAPQPQARQDHGFNAPPPQMAEVPTAAPVVATPPSGTGAPATRVTRLATRARPVAKTPFAKNLTTLLNSGQGLALAIVLQEILGPPRCKKE